MLPETAQDSPERLRLASGFVMISHPIMFVKINFTMCISKNFFIARLPFILSVKLHIFVKIISLFHYVIHDILTKVGL